mmetsp:Transcript_97922/g.277011  ORF Transcript_97922/g.277011 Transcript_97922/m.277011 type:complete len:221 (-) Transcript_97922:388-1050(-)
MDVCVDARMAAKHGGRSHGRRAPARPRRVRRLCRLRRPRWVAGVCDRQGYVRNDRVRQAEEARCRGGRGRRRCRGCCRGHGFGLRPLGWAIPDRSLAQLGLGPSFQPGGEHLVHRRAGHREQADRDREHWGQPCHPLSTRSRRCVVHRSRSSERGGALAGLACRRACHPHGLLLPRGRRLEPLSRFGGFLVQGEREIAALETKDRGDADGRHRELEAVLG